MKRKEGMRKQKCSRLVSDKTTRWSLSVDGATVCVYEISDEC